MDGNTFDRLERLAVNNELINTSLEFEEQLLSEFLLDESISESVMGKLKSANKLYNKTQKLREEISDLIKEIKHQHIQETSGEIGVLYGSRHEKILYKMLEMLKDIAKKHRINIICFKIDDLDVKGNCVKGILVSNGDTREIISSLPELIFNMGYYTKASNRKKMKQLRLKKDLRVINPSNRLNQYVIFDMVSALFKDNQVMMPYTMFTLSNLYDYLERYNIIFLIPENKSPERKYIVIEESGMNYNVYIGPSKKAYSKEGLYEYLTKIIQDKKYFIMKGAPGIKLNDLILEARVYIQKGCSGDWHVTEMIAKHELFSKDSIYRDKCYPLDEVLSKVIKAKSGEIIKKLGEDAVSVCTYLENYLSDVSSCIVDFIITDKGDNHLVYFGGMEDKEFLVSLENGESWWKHFRNSINYMIHLKNSKVISDE